MAGAATKDRNSGDQKHQGREWRRPHRRHGERFPLMPHSALPFVPSLVQVVTVCWPPSVGVSLPGAHVPKTCPASRNSQPREAVWNIHDIVWERLKFKHPASLLKGLSIALLCSTRLPSSSPERGWTLQNT